MYFPKSQIITNLFTNGGKLIYSDTLKEYKGYYFRTSGGQFFTGKTPQNLPNIELVGINPQIEGEDENNINAFDKTQWVISEEGYVSSTNTNINITVSSPKYCYPSPTEEDYEIGEFNRFFLKKTNEIKFIEISEEEYNKYSRKIATVQYELYQPIKMAWELGGTKEEAYEINYRTSKRIETLEEVYGFPQYFKKKFSEFHKDNLG